MDKAEAQKLADIAVLVASHTRCFYRRLPTTFDEAQVELNGGPGQIHQYGGCSGHSNEPTIHKYW